MISIDFCEKMSHATTRLDVFRRAMVSTPAIFFPRKPELFRTRDGVGSVHNRVQKCIFRIFEFGSHSLKEHHEIPLSVKNQSNVL